MLKYGIIFRQPNFYRKLLIVFSSSIRMSGENIVFDDKKINKSNFYKKKKLFNTYDMEVDEILIFKKESYGQKSSVKYFLGYTDDVIRPLCIKLPQMIGYLKHFDSNTTMSLKVNDNRLLKKYTKTWGKSQHFNEY